MKQPEKIDLQARIDALEAALRQLVLAISTDCRWCTARGYNLQSRACPRCTAFKVLDANVPDKSK